MALEWHEKSLHAWLSQDGILKCHFSKKHSNLYWHQNYHIARIASKMELEISTKKIPHSHGVWEFNALARAGSKVWFAELSIENCIVTIYFSFCVSLTVEFETTQQLSVLQQMRHVRSFWSLRVFETGISKFDFWKIPTIPISLAVKLLQSRKSDQKQDCAISSRAQFQISCKCFGFDPCHESCSHQFQ